MVHETRRARKLVPDKELTNWLRKDYREMEEMIFGEVPAFDEIIQTLKEMEDTINT